MALVVGLTASASAGSLTGSFSSVASGSNVNLTVMGKLDWVHWGLYTDSSLNRKAGGAPMISNFKLVGSGNGFFLAAYQYTDNANGYSWLNGDPEASVTNTTTGVWAYQASMVTSSPMGSGFEITVPADTATKTVQVFVGAYAAKGQFTASLSDGSAPSFTSGATATVNNMGNGPGGVFTINYAANSPGQTLTLRWVVATVYDLNGGGNVTLQAATLTAPGANNTPYVTLTSPTNNTILSEPASVALKAAAQDFDGTVTNVAFYSGTNLLADMGASPYEFTWSNVPRGRYTVTAIATDNLGASSTSRPVSVLVYGSGGGQTNFVESAPATVDLTVEGTADWAHWGLTSGASFDYKYLVQRKISNFTPLGTNAVQNYADNYTAFSWNDGTPNSSAAGTPTGVAVTGIDNGFRLTVPADTEPRQLKIYVGGYGAQGEFQAYLSDLSAAPFVDSSVSSVYDNRYVVYTIQYTAASAGQELNVIYRCQNLFDLTYGNVTLQAATLQGPIGPMSVILGNPVVTANGFEFSFLTQTDRIHVIQYSDVLPASTWETLTELVGNGSVTTVNIPDFGEAQRYFRVQTK